MADSLLAGDTWLNPTPVHVAITIEKSTHSGHIINKPKPTFHLEKRIPVSVFNADYPEEPKTFAEALRKARIDAGLQIKDLAKELGVTEDSVINWEIRGMIPAKVNLKRVLRRFPGLRTHLG